MSERLHNLLEILHLLDEGLEFEPMFVHSESKLYLGPYFLQAKQGSLHDSNFLLLDFT